jgi:hypothetical protein
MPTEEVVVRFYLNMFWETGGVLERARSLIDTFHEEISITTQCQMDRIRLFCSHDAMLNALVLTQVAAEFLSMKAEELVRERAAAFDRSLRM